MKGTLRPCLLLTLLTFAAFAPAIRNGFTNWDDPDYITEDRLIRAVSVERVVHAFTRFHFVNYNPLQTVSYMLDHAVWGLDARGFLATNVALHLLAGLMVWKILLSLSGSRWIAAAAAGLFLLHPTRCESVVWLSERKDVLSGVFAMAAVWIHLRRVHASPAAAETASQGAQQVGLQVAHQAAQQAAQEAAQEAAPRRSGFLYAASLAAFLLALLSKSQVVPLPLVLWAIDLHLRRPWRRSLTEMAPFLTLSAAFSAVTLAARQGEETEILASTSLGQFDPTRPLAALAVYARNLLFPFALSPLYRSHLSPGEGWALGLSGLALLLALLVAMARSWRRERIVWAGGAWFLLLLLPVSGIVPNQIQAADRYLYLPAIGLAWPLAHFVRRVLSGRPAGAKGALLLAAGLAVVLTAGYSTVWRDPEALWGRVFERFPDAPAAQANLGMHFLSRGRVDDARGLFEKDLERPPFLLESFFGLAEVRRIEGRVDEAVDLHRRAIEVARGGAKAAVRAAGFLEDVGRIDEALAVIREHRPRPSFKLHQVLFRIHLSRGDLDAARAEALRSVEVEPFHEESWYHLALVEERRGDLQAAETAYRRSIACRGASPVAHEALALLLLGAGRSAEAIHWLDAAPERTGAGWNLLALSLLETGEMERSHAAAMEATRLQPQNAGYWANRAQIALRRGRSDDAERAATRAAAERRERRPKSEEDNGDRSREPEPQPEPQPESQSQPEP